MLGRSALLAAFLIVATTAVSLPASATSGDIIFDQTFVATSNTKTFTVAVPATASYTMEVSLSSSAFTGMTIGSFPGCAGWTPYTTRIIYSGPTFGFFEAKNCGSVSSGNQTLTVTLGQGAAITHIRIYET